MSTGIRNKSFTHCHAAGTAAHCMQFLYKHFTAEVSPTDLLGPKPKQFTLIPPWLQQMEMQNWASKHEEKPNRAVWPSHPQAAKENQLKEDAVLWIRVMLPQAAPSHQADAALMQLGPGSVDQLLIPTCSFSFSPVSHWRSSSCYLPLLHNL